FDQGLGGGVERAVAAADDDQIGLAAMLEDPRPEPAHVGRALLQDAHAAGTQHLQRGGEIHRALSAGDVGEQKRLPLRRPDLRRMSSPLRSLEPGPAQAVFGARGPATSHMMKPTTGRRRINSVHNTLLPVEDLLPSTLTSAQTSAIRTRRPRKPPTSILMVRPFSSRQFRAGTTTARPGESFTCTSSTDRARRTIPGGEPAESARAGVLSAR